MKMGELIRHGLPAEVIALWQARESGRLLPLQELAVKRHGLFEPGNLMIQAPTSSGKTFIGEMAALQAALQRKKVVYLVPLKALAEEKYLDFQEKYAAYGVDVIVSTRDHREFDERFEEGRFSVAVAVYEKFAQLLVRRPERLEEIALVIADELELLSDPERGAEVELLLAHVLRSGCRILGLSAVLGHADKLAAWMNARLTSYDRRPVELRYGVLHAGKFRYRTYNDFSESEEALVDSHSESPWEILTENLSAFVERGETCLVFVKAKHESRRGAELLAQRVRLGAAAEALEALRALEPTHSRECLLNTLANGVAFHNADLSPEERRLVEAAFRRGEVKVLVSTSTLAQGLNLPAQNVFIATDKWRYDSRFGMPWKTPILRGEYENMGGRAGRYGASLPFGRALLVAATPFDEETLWRRYVEGEREGIEPRLAQEPLEDHVLRLVAGRTCRTEEELCAFFNATLSGQWVWCETLTLEEIDCRIRLAMHRAIDNGMVARSPEGRLSPTPFGQAVATKGIGIETARAIEAWLRESERRAWSDIDLVLAAALTPDGRMVQVSLTGREYEHADYPAQLKRLTCNEDLAVDVPLNRLRNCKLMPFFEEVRAIKIALFLIDWMDQTPLYDLEERYHVMTGQVIGAAEQVSWLVDAAAAIAQAFGAAEPFVARLQALAERLQHGVAGEGVPLARLRLPSLNRRGVAALIGAGLHTWEALAVASPRALERYLEAGDVCTLKQHAARQARSAPAQAAAEAPAQTPRPVLLIDERHPCEIELDGVRIALQEKQFLLLCALAEAPGECVPYERIYRRVWGDAIVEQNQMHFQKRQVLNRIAKALPHREELIKTVPKRGFSLDLDPAQVHVTLEGAVTAA